MKRILLIALAIVAAGGGYWWYRVSHETTGELRLHGNVEVRQVNLGFKVAGRIETLAVDEGDRVHTGQTLASLEKIYFRESLAQMRAQADQAAANYAKLKAGYRVEEIAQARAAVAEREATLANATITRKRAESLLKTPAGSQKVFDDTQAAERQAEALLNSAREALRLQEAGYRKEDIAYAKAQLDERKAVTATIERQLADADLIAPGDGTVLSRVREVGAIVQPGETVFVVSLTSPVWVRTYVTEPDLGRIRPGMPVTVHTDTPGGKVYRGKVGFISTAAEFTPKTVQTDELRTSLVYRLRVVVDGNDEELRQGMPVTVELAPASEGTPVASRAP
ncbi:secretion protein HlyD family protein [Rhodomicrobium vannielii ATCC 17100]|uniref:Secretion protein HlyD family protein n=1 Tax=Rhodomicrobium vannielii (strain ATCC 17100 / DSM 162 / LMG 4299 / NCIMB 10020 / ATH 3.1.1) TaxID=648757 RepID=E3I4E1_RHOVT|nr:secretion protein HlyD [Rhodomicrobium vannielii]ADP70456.1 secretion protein HlyD family protein [Rhodomicrobium vannielii ATCC 17100]